MKDRLEEKEEEIAELKKNLKNTCTRCNCKGIHASVDNILQAYYILHFSDTLT